MNDRFTYNLVGDGFEYVRNGGDEVLSFDEFQLYQHALHVGATAAPQRVDVLRLLHQDTGLNLGGLTVITYSTSIHTRGRYRGGIQGGDRGGRGGDMGYEGCESLDDRLAQDDRLHLRGLTIVTYRTSTSKHV
jgi:hypothetical protein